MPRKLVACLLLGLLIICQPAMARRTSTKSITLNNVSCPASAFTNSALTYTYSVLNKVGTLWYVGYSSSYPSIKIVVTLPSNVTYSSYSGTNWTCSYASSKLTCSYSTGYSYLSSGKTTNPLTVMATTPATVGSATTTATATVVNGNSTYTSSTSCSTAINNPAPGYMNSFDNAGTCAGSAINTKIAGKAFDLKINAMNAARTAVDTTVNAGFEAYLLDYSTINTSSFNTTTNCPTALTMSNNRPTSYIAKVTGTLSGGVGVASFPAISAAYRKVNVFAINASNINNYGCSTDNFAIRPNAFTVTAQDSNWLTAGTTRTLNNTSASGGTVHAAGEPFTLTVTAVDANGAAMSSYTNLGTSYFFDAVNDTNLTPDVSVDSVILPSGADVSTVDVMATFDTVLGSGQIRANDAAYSDVGAFRLQVTDSVFAMEDIANSCSTPTDRNIQNTPASTTIGRFIPSLITATGQTTPKLKTFDSDNTSCASRSFTYVGQPFGYATVPAFTVKAWAQDFDNIYLLMDKHTHGGRLGTLSVAGGKVAYSNSNGQTLDTSLTGTATLTDGDGTAAPKGSAIISTPTSDKLSFTRSSTPVAPFNAAISMTTTLADCADQAGTGTSACIPVCLDSSESITNGTVPSTCTSPASSLAVSFSNIAFDAATTPSAFRYGYLSLPATASVANTTTNMTLSLDAKYWTGSAWAANTLDNCTSVPANTIALSNYTKNLSQCETLVTTAGKLTSGSMSMILSAPGSNNGGSVDLSPNLGSTASSSYNAVAGCAAGSPTAASPASLNWLQCSSTYLSNCVTNGSNSLPKTTATFNGVTQLPNRTRYLYMREMF